VNPHFGYTNSVNTIGVHTYTQCECLRSTPEAETFRAQRKAYVYLPRVLD